MINYTAIANDVGVRQSNIFSTIEEDMRLNILKQYNRATLHIDSRLEGMALAKIIGDTDLISAVEFTENEISPFNGGSIPLQVKEEDRLSRAPSIRRFKQQAYSFSLLERLLCRSFMQDPVTERRPYPSGGALYVIDPLLLVFSSQIERKPKIKSGIYHFRAARNILQPLVYATEESLLFKFFSESFTNEDKPAFALIYIMQLSKAVFKYGYRGYHNALFETGIMAQKVSEVAQTLELANCMWASFNEHQVQQFCSLDPCEHLPLLMQLFGHPSS